MSLPILQPSTTTTIQIRGDVNIDNSAIIADGVILNAPEGSKIIIHGGVCLGMGCIITAFPGATIEIKANAILGAGCLIFGSCTVGNQVSLGSAVTIYNTDIDSLSVVPSGTVRGDRSRTIVIDSEPVKEECKSEDDKQESDQNISVSQKNISDTLKQQKHIDNYKNKYQYTDIPTNAIEEDKINSAKNEDQKNPINIDDDPWGNKSQSPKEVVGQVYINKLLVTLFPEKNNPL